MYGRISSPSIRLLRDMSIRGSQLFGVPPISVSFRVESLLLTSAKFSPSHSVAIAYVK